MNVIRTGDYEFHLVDNPYAHTIETETDKCMMPVFDALASAGYMPIMQSDRKIMVNTFTNIEKVLRSLDQHRTSIIVKNKCNTFTGVMICFVMIGIVISILIETDIIHK